MIESLCREPLSRQVSMSNSFVLIIRMRLFRSMRQIAWATVLSACILFPAAAPAAERDQVLVLHSYHKADWTDALNRGILGVLGVMPSHVVLLLYGFHYYR